MNLPTNSQVMHKSKKKTFLRLTILDDILLVCFLHIFLIVVKCICFHPLTPTLVSAFILSRLDYCNSLLSGCPRSLILRLQKVQNNAARLILGISKREHISPHLASLHWLPIDSRIKYKLACICYNCMSTNSPPYLSDLLTVYTAARQLRSSSDNSVLRRPSVRTVSYGQRSFSYSAPSAWNSLPQQVRSSDNVSTFRSRTKTHLFRLAY